MTPRAANCLHVLEWVSSPLANPDWTVRAGGPRHVCSWAGKPREQYLPGQAARSKHLSAASYTQTQKSHLHPKPSPRPSGRVTTSQPQLGWETHLSRAGAGDTPVQSWGSRFQLLRPSTSSGTCTHHGEHCMSAKSLQSCPTLYDPMDCSWPGSSVHGILQARILE